MITPTNDLRVLINVYPKNALRLKRVEALRKSHGISRTQWINSAIREKLDRDHPETDCPESEYIPATIPLDSPEAQKLYEKAKQDADAAQRLLSAFADPSVSPPLVKASPTGQTSPIPVAKLAEDQEEDFWGDEQLAKVRANVKKHCQ